HHGHAGNVFLEEGVDAGDGRAYAAIRVAHELTENHGDDEDARQDGQRVHGQAGVDFEEQAGHDREQEEVVDHSDHAGSEEIVQGVNVRGDARDQAADGIAVKITHRQELQVAEDFAAHVVHGLLPDALHDADLNVLGQEIENQHEQEDAADDFHAA